MDAEKAMDTDLSELLDIIMTENNLHHADTMDSAVDLYVQLRLLTNQTLLDGQ